MRHLFLIARLYPYWALPLALVLGELGRFLRRRKNPICYLCYLLSVALLGGIVAWFMYRGDIHSDQWIRYIMGEPVR